MTATRIDQLGTVAIDRLIRNTPLAEKSQAIRDQATHLGMHLSEDDVSAALRLLDDPTAVLHRERNYLLNEVWRILNGDGSATDKLYYLEEFLPSPVRPSLAVVSPAERRAAVWMACEYNDAVWTITGVDEDDEVVYLTSARGDHLAVEFDDVCPNPALTRPNAT